MLYKIREDQINLLLSKPETGMGYQVITATSSNSYLRNEYIVLNSEVAIEVDGYQNTYLYKVFSEGIKNAKFSAREITLNNIRVLSENEFRNTFHEPKNEKERGAIDNPKENADGQETFVRLSAFDDDKRVDKINKRLRPGSYTTTFKDYVDCKTKNDDPIHRYALPNDDKIEWAFHIQPLKQDTLQRGTVQPANGKRGGGKEVYFENGTSNGTFLKQTPY